MLDAVTCNGIALVYNSTVAYTSYLEIKNYSLLDNVVTFDCNIFLFVRNHPAMVVVRISSTTFISNDKIHFLDAVFSHYGHRTYHEHRIQFINCYFRHNIIDSIVSAIGEEVKVCAVIVYIEFIDSQFISNRGKTQHSHVIDVVGGNIRMPITLQGCLFHKNTNVQLIGFVTSESFYCSKVGVIFIKNTIFSFNNLTYYLFNVSQASVYLEGPVFFTGISSIGIFAVILNYESKRSVLTSHGKISILNNSLQHFLHYSMDTSDPSISVKENTHILIKHNAFHNAFFSGEGRWFIDPHPLCLFQFYSNHNDPDTAFNNNLKNDQNYSIIFQNNIMPMVTTKEYTKFTHCSWLPDAAFQKIIPLEVTERFIHFKGNDIQLWDTEKMLCICHNASNQNCEIDQFGPIYSGETLTLKMYKRGSYSFSNELYYKFNRRMLKTVCKGSGTKDIAIQFGECKNVNFTIWSDQSNWCEVFVQKPVDTFHHPSFDVDYFYVLFHPGCPMGFVKYNGKCECDHVLKYVGVFTCDINTRTILRPANSWIAATTNNYSHNYTVSLKCPFDYCLPRSSHLELSTPNSQCQFNRSGLLCGQCQNGLSTVFGSSQCYQCSNMYLLLVLMFAVLGVLLVLVMFVFNFTVTDGTINGFIFYVNIAGINDSTFFPLHQFSYVFISIVNLDLGIQTCFYNTMDDYAKMWLQLVFPLYLILIAVLLIIASRHCTKVQRLTARRALPVLATLFLLSYTKILRTVSNVLFSYSMVNTLLHHSTKLLWSVDANVPLLGMKFIILFVACLLTFLLMIPYSLILTFLRFFYRFRLITKLKPVLDVYQGPYKDNCYYWTGLQLVMRAVFFALSSLDRNINLTVGVILLTVLSGVHGLLHPLKSNVQNYQEFFWLINLQGLYVFSLYGQDASNITFVNILVVIAMVHFSFIVVYHIITYTWIGERMMSVCSSTCAAVRNVIKLCVRFSFNEGDYSENLPMNGMPEEEAYCEYRELLIGD